MERNSLNPNKTTPTNIYNGDMRNIPRNSKVSGSYHGKTLNGDVYIVSENNNTINSRIFSKMKIVTFVLIVLHHPNCIYKLK